MLAADEQRELDLAVWEYLLGRGLPAAAEALQREAALSPPVPSEGLLQRKWAAVLHLQARVEQLETAEREEHASARPRSLQVLGAATGELLHPRLRPVASFAGQRDAVSAAALHAREPVFAAGGPDAAIRLFDFELAEQLAALRGHTFAVHCLAWSGDALVSGSADMTLRLWAAPAGSDPAAFAEFACARTFVGHEHAVSALLHLPGTQLTVSCSRDCTLRLWDRGTGFCRRRVAGVHEQWARCLDANDRHLASSGNDQRLFVFDLPRLLQPEGGESPLLLAFDAHDNYVEALRLGGGAGETLAYSAGRDKSVRVWDYLKATCLAVLAGHDGWVKSLALLEAEGLLLSAGEDRSLRLWDLRRRRLVWVERAAHEHFVLATDYRAAGRVLLSGSLDRSARLWQLVDAAGEEGY